jgi:hypothetical protein
MFGHCAISILCAQFASKVTGGTDIVKKILAGLTCNTALQRVALIDAHGYDAAPALATLEARVLMFSSN